MPTRPTTCLGTAESVGTPAEPLCCWSDTGTFVVLAAWDVAEMPKLLIALTFPLPGARIAGSTTMPVYAVQGLNSGFLACLASSTNLSSSTPVEDSFQERFSPFSMSL